MKYTVSLKENRVFRRLYAKGRSAVSPTMVLYCRKNGRRENRLGLTTGTKLGHAVSGTECAAGCGKFTACRSTGSPPATILSSWPGSGGLQPVRRIGTGFSPPGKKAPASLPPGSDAEGEKP